MFVSSFAMALGHRIDILHDLFCYMTDSLSDSYVSKF